jgi:anti-sigma B factor antagonist
MNLSIEIRQIDHITVLELAGRVSVLEFQLNKLVEALIARGERFFVINLANVSYMDNSGVGQLCLVYTVARNRGGDMKLLKPTERIKKLLHITKLDTVFQSFDSEADAIASFPASQMSSFSISANGYCGSSCNS